MKKIIAGLTASVMMFGSGYAVPAHSNVTKMIVANAETSDYEVIKEGYFTYNVYSDHAEVATYKNYNQVAVELKSEINGVPLTNIANYAFCSTSLTSIVIPNSVKSIGAWAFDACNKLETVVIADSVESIGADAFSRCSALKNINIPNSVTSIGNGAFSGCDNLETIEIPDSVITFGNNIFDYCSNLKYINIPSSMIRIGNRTFYCDYSLKEITIPDTVNSIGSDAFNYCRSLESITIPASVNNIGSDAFSNCKALESIIILNPNCYIYDSKSTIFNGTKDSKVYFDGTIYGYMHSTAQDYAEKYHYKFIALAAPESPESDFEFNAETGTITKYIGSDKDVVIPSVINSVAVKNIGDEAFFENESLTYVTIPDGITSIGLNAFAKCISLDSVTLGSSVPDGLRESGIPTAIKMYIPASSYESYKPYETDGYAFYDSKTSEYISFVASDDWTKLGDRTYFKYSDDGTTLYVEGEGTIHMFAFYAERSGRELESSVKKVIIGNGITEINTDAFYDCEYIETVEMKNVKKVGPSAFGGCISLKSVEMNSVKSIYLDAFGRCESLASVTLGTTVPTGFKYIPVSAKIKIPVSSYESYKRYEEDGYNFGFSDIKGIGYILEGQIGIRLATDLSADKLAVMCGDKTIDLTQKDGYVEFFVAAQDMAKEYTVYYVDGEIEIAKFNPKSNLSGYEDTKYAEVAEALITYCETANAYFNGGEIADMSSEYDDVINAITPNTVDMGEDYDSSSLILESNTIVRHYYTKNDGTMTAKGNYFYKEESVDPTKFARTDTYSVNDYIYKVLNSDKADANLKNLCVTLYNYGVAAETLKNGGNK